jgi:hypothetical protein
LEEAGLHQRRQVAVLCLAVVTAILVSSVFDPQLEGPQVAILLWTCFGVGITVTTTRSWYDHGRSGATATAAAGSGAGHGVAP